MLARATAAARWFARMEDSGSLRVLHLGDMAVPTLAIQACGLESPTTSTGLCSRLAFSQCSPIPLPRLLSHLLPPHGTWEVTGDGCEMDGQCVQSKNHPSDCGCEMDGQCVQSKNHPSDFGNNEACTICVFSVPLATEAFETESRYDFLRAGGVGYSGSSGPPNGGFDGTIIMVFRLFGDQIWLETLPN